MSEDEEEDEQPQSNLIPISCHRKVTDADEEIFILYTCSPPEIGQSGLGYVNNSHDLLEITIDLDSASILPPTIKTLDHENFQDSTQSSNVASKKKGRSGNTLKNNNKSSTSKKNGNLDGRAGVESKQNEIKVILHQDSTSLRSVAGDTGSVVWRSSVIFSQSLLKQWTFLQNPSNRHSPFKPLISLDSLRSSNVLEIGSGTGILPTLLLSHPEFINQGAVEGKGCSWVATDQSSSLQILNKNLSRLNGFQPEEVKEDDEGKIKISCKELDWNKVYDLFSSGNERMIHLLRRELFSSFSSHLDGQSSERKPNHNLHEPQENKSSIQQPNLKSIPIHTSPKSYTYPDLIISLDCIFNPSLFTPLISTLTLFCQPNHTLVLLVIELRSSEMVREFLKDWLEFDEKHGLKEIWKIKSLENEELDDNEMLDEGIRKRLGGMSKGYALWLAWRE